VDALGLEERLITMAELESDTSFIAAKQRDDSLSAFKNVSEKLIKTTASVSLVAALAVSAVLGTGLITAAALYKGPAPQPITYRISYGVMGEGVIEGDLVQELRYTVIEGGSKKEIIESKRVSATDGGALDDFLNNEGSGLEIIDAAVTFYQSVTAGADATPALARSKAGNVFVGWADGFGSSYRIDAEVSKDAVRYAVFEKMEDAGEDTPDTDEFPMRAQTSGDGGSNDTPPDNTTPPTPQGDGNFLNNGKIIDGATDLDDGIYANAVDEAMERLAKDNNLTEAQKQMIIAYLRLIKG
jgi:hypothetical protein